MPNDFRIKDDWIFGPWRKAINDFTPVTRPFLRALFQNRNTPLNIQIEKVDNCYETAWKKGR